MKNLTLKQKITRMFITGFQGDSYEENPYFKELLNTGLGGVIFFTHNIQSAEGFINLIKKLKKDSACPMFFSIDSEGGRVERTENIHGGKKYLSARYAYEKGCEFLKKQTQEIASELLSYGINMNFAPVLDVNTNKNNPIIGERAFSANPDDVIKAAEIVLKEYEKQGIITVGKHFPGHGQTDADSHKILPEINLSEKEIRDIHLKPFIATINSKIPAIMAAHVLYPVWDKENPASVSEKIINDILINELGFSGVIITDDMEMNGIKIFSKLQACIKAINAGVNMFIFRYSDEKIIELIDMIEKAVEEGMISEEKIDNSLRKIENLKCRYGII